MGKRERKRDLDSEKLLGEILGRKWIFQNKDKNCHHSLQFMRNFNGSLRDLEIMVEEEQNNNEKETNIHNKKLHFKDFNDTPTEFNNEILSKDHDVSINDILKNSEVENENIL